MWSEYDYFCLRQVATIVLNCVPFSWEDWLQLQFFIRTDTYKTDLEQVQLVTRLFCYYTIYNIFHYAENTQRKAILLSTIITLAFSQSNLYVPAAIQDLFQDHSSSAYVMTILLARMVLFCLPVHKSNSRDVCWTRVIKELWLKYIYLVQFFFIKLQGNPLAMLLLIRS